MDGVTGKALADFFAGQLLAQSCFNVGVAQCNRSPAIGTSGPRAGRETYELGPLRPGPRLWAG